MNHLAVLKWLNVASVVLLLVSGGLTAVSVGVSSAALVVADERMLLAAGPMVLFTVLVLFVLFVLAGFCAVAAWRLERGGGRAAQTVAALASVTSVPLGTAYGVYALWVCWVNPETRDGFTTSGVRDGLLAGLGLALFGLPLLALIGLSIPPLFPTNLARLDGEWEPFHDVDQREPLEGCALTQVEPDCRPAVPTEVVTREVVFPTRSDALGWTALKGTLHLPRGLAGPRPAVVLVHGSGPTDRDASAPGELVAAYDVAVPVFAELANHLAAQGLVVLRYDKRACGRCYPEEHAQVDWEDFRFGLFLEDALAAADHLAGLPEVDGDALVVMGHSQGGGFAPHLAARDDRFVAVVMLAGMSGTFRDALLGQLEGLASIRQGQGDFVSAWAVRAQAATIDLCVGQLDGAYDPADGCLGGGVSLRALAEYEDLNRTTLDVIGTLEVPLLAVGGTVDRNVPPEDLLAVQRAAAGRDAEVHLIGGMGHGLQELVDPEVPAGLDPELLEVLDGFLGSVGN